MCLSSFTLKRKLNIFPSFPHKIWEEKNPQVRVPFFFLIISSVSFPQLWPSLCFVFVSIFFFFLYTECNFICKITMWKWLNYTYEQQYFSNIHDFIIFEMEAKGPWNSPKSIILLVSSKIYCVVKQFWTFQS